MCKCLDCWAGTVCSFSYDFLVALPTEARAKSPSKEWLFVGFALELLRDQISLVVNEKEETGPPREELNVCICAPLDFR